MTMTCESNRFNIINLRKPPTMNKIIEFIPKPKGAVPNFGLPKWKLMPLESKIPMVKGPEGAYIFSRQKLGKKLWLSSRDGEFNLWDPNCYEIKFDYDPLHDENLKDFFSQPKNIKRLIKSGLVTENLDAKCSLKNYNNYRKFLRKLYCDRIKKRLKERLYLFNEERILKYTDELAQKEIKMLKQREKLEEIHKKSIRREKQKLEEKLKEDIEKKNKLREKLKLLKELEIQDIKRRKEKRLLHSKHIKEKLQTAENHKRQMIIKTLVIWKKKEQRRLKMIKIRTREEEEKRKAAIDEKWKKREEFQKQQIKKDEFLLNCINERKREFLKKYNMKVQAERARMKQVLQHAKKALKCYYARRLAENKDIICCSKYLYNEKMQFNELQNLSCTITPYPTYSRGYGNKLKDLITAMSKMKEEEIMELKKMKDLDKINEIPSYTDVMKEIEKLDKPGRMSRTDRMGKDGKRWKKGKGKYKRKGSSKDLGFEESVLKTDGKSEAQVELETVTEPENLISQTRLETESKLKSLQLQRKCRCALIKAAQKK